MSTNPRKPLMRSLGEFFGHIIKAARTDPSSTKPVVVRKQVEEEDHGDMVLRRTTIEEVEFRPAESRPSTSSDAERKP